MHLELTDGIDPRTIFERKDQLSKMKQIGNAEVWQMLTMNADGYKFEEIAGHFLLKTGTVKVRVSRLKNDIIQISW
jgi:hypothetical protein